MPLQKSQKCHPLWEVCMIFMVMLVLPVVILPLCVVLLPDFAKNTSRPVTGGVLLAGAVQDNCTTLRILPVLQQLNLWVCLSLLQAKYLYVKSNY